MTACRFFLQGRCRYGERCWNEHPRGGGGGGGGGGGRGRALPPAYPQPPPHKQQPISSGGNRGGWNAPNQRYTSVIQPSNFSRSSTWWGGRGQEKPSFGSYQDSGSSHSGNRNFGFSQNRFSALSGNQSGAQNDEDDKLLEGIVRDMDIWESSGQWMFSVYSPVKDNPNVSGFADISPEELRLEYYNFRANNDLQSFLNSVQQFIHQWRNRLRELKSINASNKGTLLSETNTTVSHSAPAFGFGSPQQTSTFGSSGFPLSSNSQADQFSFKPSSVIVPASSDGTAVFGSSPNPTTTTPPVLFGKPVISSAAAFSFKSPDTSGFGSAGFPGFQAPAPAGITAVTGVGSGTAATGFGVAGSSLGPTFPGQSGGGFGIHSAPAPPSAPSSGKTAGDLFTPRPDLSVEELKQFEAKKFVLGKIPLKPPPVELLNV
ncbi:nucleoporin NUP42 [Tachyglossus aculeatus]|uniref:nucleoporin NUP42 n=1 Tax=Tachyglossus aculeatus TaxID=9261 RepID=UPI0018F6CF1A|nr:nucleoporin NUP42 [Tachyglossus aculeatus]